MEAVQSYSCCNPDGEILAEREFRHRVANTYFDHGYSHFWKGNREVAKTAFWRAFSAGGRPIRSLVYLLAINLEPVRDFVLNRR